MSEPRTEPPVQIPDVLEPVQIPDVLEPVPRCPTCFHLEPVQIPVSHVPQPPMQILPEPMNILHVSVQIPEDPEPVHSSVTRPTATYADSPRTYEHSTCPQHVQIPVSHVPQPPMQILHVTESVQIPVSHVPRTYAVLHVSEPADSQCHTSHSHLCRVSQNLCRFQCHTSQPPVQSLPEPMQLLPELDMLTL
ncbi:hypothetical protein TNCV_2523861 [Trichonephila clavipes]|nr:hypothetical protein TNCV_2523861 [Trichonephila clavipes]